MQPPFLLEFPSVSWWTKNLISHTGSRRGCCGSRGGVFEAGASLGFWRGVLRRRGNYGKYDGNIYKWGISNCYVWLLEGTQKFHGRSCFFIVFFNINFGSLRSMFPIILGENTHFVDPFSIDFMISINFQSSPILIILSICVFLTSYQPYLCLNISE